MRTIRSASDSGAACEESASRSGFSFKLDCIEGNDYPASDVLAQLQACPPRPRRRNNHLSVSRLRLLEQCPAAFEYRYIKKLDSEEEAVPADFGVLLHEVLEITMQWVVDTEFTGQISEQQVLDTYRATWPKFESLIGVELYQEGAGILRDYIRRHGNVDHFEILDVEMEFNIHVGEFLVNGYIDRVDRVDDFTIRIVDYKSSRMLFSRDEVEHDLQMSVYALAAKERWPWATNLEFEFHMIRHGIEQRTSRSQSQLDDAAAYVVSMGRYAETTETFPARLNMNCGSCAYRRICPEYRAALEGKVEKIAYDREDLESVARAQQQAAKLAKIYYARRKETEDILRPRLETHDELVLEEIGVKYRLIKYTQDKVYPIDKTIALLSKYTDLSEEEARRRFLRIDTTGLDRWVDEHLREQSASKAKLVEMQLDLAAEKTYGQKFDAQTIKGPSRTLKPSAPKGGSLPTQTKGPP